MWQARYETYFIGFIMIGQKYKLDLRKESKKMNFRANIIQMNNSYELQIFLVINLPKSSKL